MKKSTRPASPGVSLPLADATLSAHAAHVAVPSYDRAALEPAVVHLGVGGFHRAHQAVVFDELAERGLCSWGITGVTLRRPDMRDALEPQAGLFTVVERSAEGDRARVVGSLLRCLFAPDDPEAVLVALADPRTRLVTLTVTGDGYGVDPVTRELDPRDPEVERELATPGRPTSVLGFLTEALDRRRRAGTAPFTVMSCDNVPRNGEVARAAVVAFARLRDPRLAAWIDDEVAFPCSMVDRITPETTPAARRLVRRTFGVDDRWPVVCEPFTQWIVEDDFCSDRPPLEAAGVQLVADVAPYERMKKRLLNGGHSALGYLGSLAGHRTTDEALEDPVIHAYLEHLLEDEIGPLIGAVPGIDLGEYRASLLERFANPSIADPLARLCGRGSTKLPAYLLPSIVDARREGRPITLLAVAVAGWMRFLRGIDDDGDELDVRDAHAPRLMRLARAGGDDPTRLLAERSIFGDLSHDPVVVREVGRALRALSRDGARATIAARLGHDLAVVA